jgi:hypothetical protein
MYAQSVVDRNIGVIYDTLGVRLHHYDDGMVDEMTAHLNSLVKSTGKDTGVEEFHRPLTREEEEYILNERLLCKFDFRYFAHRYAVIEIAAIEGRPATDVGRLGKVGFMRPQEVFLNKLERSELAMYEMMDRGEMVDGLRYFINKGRQLHFTAVSRMLSNHRTLFWPDTNAIAASVNEDMVGELYRRDKVMFTHLPWFIKPRIEFDVKNQNLSFKPLGSGTLYHQANQHGGMGMGRMIPVAHMTECAFWDDMVGQNTLFEKLDYHLRAAIPQSINTLYILESTSNGLGGWWYDQIQLILRGKSTFDLFFCPWYAADRKYRRTPPEGWQPIEDTLSMADKAERTSAAYLGFTTRPDKYQMYWYETEKASYEKRLAVFLSNYPTTLDEAFQNFRNAAFSPELLQDLRKGVGKLYGSYDIFTAA